MDTKEQRIPFAIETAAGWGRRSSRSDLINLYAHKEQSGAKDGLLLMNTEGIEAISDVPGDEEILGIYQFGGIVYAATGNSFLRFDGGADSASQLMISAATNNATWTKIADVSFPNGTVRFSDNGISIMMVGGNGYAYTPQTGEFKNMDTEEGWYSADTVTFMDGYFIFNRSGTGQFFISKLYSTEINPIDWATGESAPDDTVAVSVIQRQLWLFGERTTEVWYDSGDADFPFMRIGGAVSDVGCASYKTVARLQKTLIWVGDDYRVYISNGYTPTSVSTPAVEKALKDSDPETLSGFVWYSAGHWFYALHIDDDLTMVFDGVTNLWHRRMSCNTDKWLITGADNLYITNDPIAWAGGTFYRMDINILTEDGEPIRREAVSLPVNKGVDHFILAKVSLDMDTGSEAFDVYGKMILNTSKDSGMTWSTDNYAYAGGVGRYGRLPSWRRLGQFRDCILKIATTDPIPIRISGLFVTVS